MKEKIGNGFLTTDHPASSYGLPVLVLDGAAYGPGDVIQSGVMAGAAVVTADDITMKFPSVALLKAAIAFVRQSPEHGPQWEQILRDGREQILAASALGSVKTEKKAKTSAENGKLGGRPKNWAVVVAYEYPGHERGEVISRHATPEAAEKAAKKSGRDSFLAIRHVNDL